MVVVGVDAGNGVDVGVDIGDGLGIDDDGDSLLIGDCYWFLAGVSVFFCDRVCVALAC